ncbi:hypothetical protein OAM96_00685 [Candidatus Poseidoniaceae archaeon]|nr:hypothetical protein [Candidatus Poseidoniaceae archaeon]
MEQAGQSISRSPGFIFILRRRSHPGQATSVRGTFFSTVKCVEQEAHCKWAGLLSTPTMRTLEHSGHPTFSSFQLRRVTGCSTLTFDEQIEQVNTPKSEGSSEEHFGQDNAGGAILDSTTASSSSMPKPHPYYS